MLTKKVLISFIMLLIVFGCNHSNSNNVLKKVEVQKPIKPNKTSKNIIVGLNPSAKKLTENWKEYQAIDEYIQQYKEISITNSLLNAKHLSELAQQLKDSIRVEKLNNPSVRIRLHVLNNETLRLADMATINHITEKEVNEENSNILNAYSALNIKINNLVKQEKLNGEVKDFINKQRKNTIDSDSITKKIK